MKYHSLESSKTSCSSIDASLRLLNSDSLMLSYQPTMMARSQHLSSVLVSKMYQNSHKKFPFTMKGNFLCILRFLFFRRGRSRLLGWYYSSIFFLDFCYRSSSPACWLARCERGSCSFEYSDLIIDDLWIDTSSTLPYEDPPYEENSEKYRCEYTSIESPYYFLIFYYYRNILIAFYCSLVDRIDI